MLQLLWYLEFYILRLVVSMSVSLIIPHISFECLKCVIITYKWNEDKLKENEKEKQLCSNFPIKYP